MIKMLADCEVEIGNCKDKVSDCSTNGTTVRETFNSRGCISEHRKCKSASKSEKQCHIARKKEKLIITVNYTACQTTTTTAATMNVFQKPY